MTSKTDSRADGSRQAGRTLEITDLTFRWAKNHSPLGYPDISLPTGEHLFLRGPSGSGKSTLMSLIGGLIVPTAGSVRVLDTDLGQLTGGQRDRFRRITWA